MGTAGGSGVVATLLHVRGLRALLVEDQRQHEGQDADDQQIQPTVSVAMFCSIESGRLTAPMTRMRPTTSRTMPTPIPMGSPSGCVRRREPARLSPGSYPRHGPGKTGLRKMTLTRPSRTGGSACDAASGQNAASSRSISDRSVASAMARSALSLRQVGAARRTAPRRPCPRRTPCPWRTTSPASLLQRDLGPAQQQPARRPRRRAPSAAGWC